MLPKMLTVQEQVFLQKTLQDSLPMLLIIIERMLLATMVQATAMLKTFLSTMP